MRLTTLFLLIAMTLTAQSYTPTEENLKARRWFEDARFGMFIHWGPSSLLGSGEWVMTNRNIHHEDYQRLQDIFNPTAFDAAQWVKLAKDAGMKYITLITRHHDGFSLWDTNQSDFNIMNTPLGRDVVKEIAEECHKQGIKLFFYYSLIDWSRGDYPYETGRTGKGTGRTEPSDWSSYFSFMKAQITELLTNYGEVSGMWFDGHWDQLDNDEDKAQQSKIDWQYEELYALIHRLQPACLIGNNHHLSPLPGEDFQMFERDLPGENKAGLSGQEVSQLPLEACETINGSWGFNITDRNHKTDRELMHYLIKAAGYGANLLLNIGPMPNGAIQPVFIARLNFMGEWLQKNGETIYGTQAGPIRPQEWGCMTQKGNKIYVHLFQKPDQPLEFELANKVQSAKTFGTTSQTITFKQSKGKVTINTNNLKFDPIDTIIVLEIK